jgi:hypothetical protein
MDILTTILLCIAGIVGFIVTLYVLQFIGHALVDFLAGAEMDKVLAGLFFAGVVSVIVIWAQHGWIMSMKVGAVIVVIFVGLTFFTKR